MEKVLMLHINVGECGGAAEELKVLLTVARWDRRRTAQEWHHDKGLLLTTYSVAKKPWNLDKNTKYSQNNRCQ